MDLAEQLFGHASTTTQAERAAQINDIKAIQSDARAAGMLEAADTGAVGCANLDCGSDVCKALREKKAEILAAIDKPTTTI